MVDYSCRMNFSFSDISNPRCNYHALGSSNRETGSRNSGQTGTSAGIYSKFPEKQLSYSYQNPFSYSNTSDASYYESCFKDKEVRPTSSLSFGPSRSGGFDGRSADARYGNFESRFSGDECKPFKDSLSPRSKKNQLCSTSPQQNLRDIPTTDISKIKSNYGSYGPNLLKTNPSASYMKNGRPQDTSVPTSASSRSLTYQCPARTEARADTRSSAACGEPVLTQGCHFINQASQADLTLSKTATSCCSSSSNFSYFGYPGHPRFPPPNLQFDHSTYNSTSGSDGIVFGPSRGM